MNARMIMAVLTVAAVFSFSAGQVMADAQDRGRADARAVDPWNYDAAQTGWVSVAIAGDGDTDLDLYIREANGGYVARNTNYSDQAAVEFFAVAGRRYVIEVHNLGDVYNIYEIAVVD